MKKRILISCILAVAMTTTAQQSPLLKKDGLYFGQKPPGKKAELFASKILTAEGHDSPIISQDESWMLIGTMEHGAKFYKSTSSGLEPSVNPMNFIIPEENNYNGLEISYSENRVYFLVWKNNDENFYFIEKTKSGWTTPKPMSDEINSYRTHWQFSLAKNENFYFASEGTILVAIFDGKTHLKPAPLKLEDNSILKGSTPFIDPDESYLIYSITSQETRKKSDLYISYKLQGDTWSMPVNLGYDINDENSLDLCPRISPNGKYLFFVSRRIGSYFKVFWADAGFIEELIPKE
ncbi:MAG: hypothetical protein KKF62_16210 [Bacteroidetes bacterium]|nr:hypothetical protein [Bacteroidota bacterium]MBU1115352.1 hypothetical protein [Bacteroidota bacterium]MBU1800516.1 hypothetical protein [Bacteroidota bacterium]